MKDSSGDDVAFRRLALMNAAAGSPMCLLTGHEVVVDGAYLAGADGVVIVAHDPGMTVLAEHLSGGAIGHMPTCAVATFQWETPDWDVATATDPDSWSFDAPGHAR